MRFQLGTGRDVSYKIKPIRHSKAKIVNLFLNGNTHRDFPFLNTLLRVRFWNHSMGLRNHHISFAKEGIGDLLAYWFLRDSPLARWITNVG